MKSFLAWTCRSSARIIYSTLIIAAAIVWIAFGPLVFSTNREGEDFPKPPSPGAPAPSAPKSLDHAKNQGCPLCCCDVYHPVNATKREALAYCLRSNRTECKKMCEEAMRRKLAALPADEVARMLKRRVPAIQFTDDMVTITEGAARQILLYIYERDLLLRPDP